MVETGRTTGTNKFSRGTFTLKTTLDVGNAVLAGGRLVGDDARLSGSWVWTSGNLGQPGSRLKLAVDAELLLKGNAGSQNDLEGVVTNLGTVRLISGDLRFRDGQFYNQVSGLIEFQGDSDLANYSTGTELLFNHGTLRKSGGTGTSLIAVPLKNHGMLDVQVGKVNVGTEHDLTGGRINCGINGPGSSGQVNLSGNAVLTGAFGANLNNGYQPKAGDSFNVVTYGSRTDVFITAVLPSAYTWETNYSGTTFSVKVLGSVVASDFEVTMDFIGGVPHLTWNSQTGERFQVQFRDDLSVGNWANLGSEVLATGNLSELFDFAASGALARFYRVQKLQ